MEKEMYEGGEDENDKSAERNLMKDIDANESDEESSCDELDPDQIEDEGKK